MIWEIIIKCYITSASCCTFKLELYICSNSLENLIKILLLVSFRLTRFFKPHTHTLSMVINKRERIYHLQNLGTILFYTAIDIKIKRCLNIATIICERELLLATSEDKNNKLRIFHGSQQPANECNKKTNRRF